MRGGGGDRPVAVGLDFSSKVAETFWAPGGATFAIFDFFQIFSGLGPDFDPTLGLLASKL